MIPSLVLSSEEFRRQEAHARLRWAVELKFRGSGEGRRRRNSRIALAPPTSQHPSPITRAAPFPTLAHYQPFPSPTRPHLQCARRIDERPPSSSLPGPLLQQHRQPLVDHPKHKSPAVALASHLCCPSVHSPRPDSHFHRDPRTSSERRHCQQSVPGGLFTDSPRRSSDTNIHCQPSGHQPTILGLLHPFIRWHFSNEPAPWLRVGALAIRPAHANRSFK